MLPLQHLGSCESAFPHHLVTRYQDVLRSYLCQCASTARTAQSPLRLLHNLAGRLSNTLHMILARRIRYNGHSFCESLGPSSTAFAASLQMSATSELKNLISTSSQSVGSFFCSFVVSAVTATFSAERVRFQ